MICVFDNASEDNTREVVQNIASSDSRVRYFRHQQNIGVIKNYNYALANVKTPYFAFLADDDVLYKDCIQNALKGLRANPDVAFWGGNTLHINGENGRIIRGTHWAWRRGGIYSSYEACKRIASGDHIEFQGLVIRTKTVQKLNFTFNENIYLLDVDLQWTLAGNAKVGFTNSVSAVMFAHEGSASSGIKNLATFWPSLHHIGNRFLEVNSLCQDDREICRVEWDKTIIFTLLLLSGRTYRLTSSALRLEVDQILRSNYSHYLVGRLGANLLRLYGRNKSLNYIAWAIIKLIYIFCRFNTLLNRLFPGQDISSINKFLKTLD